MGKTLRLALLVLAALAFHPGSTTAQSGLCLPMAGGGVGAPAVLDGTDGEQLTITVNAVRDPSPYKLYVTNPEHVIAIDWTVANTGSVKLPVALYELKVQTSDGWVSSGNLANDAPARIENVTLGPGQMQRGFTLHNLPAGSRAATAFYQTSSGTQRLVADLTGR